MNLEDQQVLEQPDTQRNTEDEQVLEQLDAQMNPLDQRVLQQLDAQMNPQNEQVLEQADVQMNPHDEQDLEQPDEQMNPQNEQPDAQMNLQEEFETQILLEENKRLKKQIYCFVCEEEECKMMYLPCKHLACCGICDQAQLTCPICKETIEIRITTFRS